MRTYEKHVLISKLPDAFEQFKNFGGTKFLTHAGKCNSCNKGCKGFSFIGNITNNYIGIIIEPEDRKIKDLYECTEFKNENSSLTKNKRNYLREFNFEM